MLLAENTLYTMYRRGGQDVVIALDPSTGKTIWETALDAPHRSGMNVEAGPGPHSTPLIAGNRIFVTTVVGHLVALDRTTGKRLWSHDRWTEYKGTFLERGYALSPLAWKDTVIVPVGGAGVAATGAICIGRLIPPGTRSSSCSRHTAISPRPVRFCSLQ